MVKLTSGNTLEMLLGVTINKNHDGSQKGPSNPVQADPTDDFVIARMRKDNCDGVIESSFHTIKERSKGSSRFDKLGASRRVLQTMATEYERLQMSSSNLISYPQVAGQSSIVMNMATKRSGG